MTNRATQLTITQGHDALPHSCIIDSAMLGCALDLVGQKEPTDLHGLQVCVFHSCS